MLCSELIPTPQVSRKHFQISCEKPCPLLFFNYRPRGQGHPGRNSYQDKGIRTTLPGYPGWVSGYPGTRAVG